MKLAIKHSIKFHVIKTKKQHYETNKKWENIFKEIKLKIILSKKKKKIFPWQNINQEKTHV